MHAAMPKSPHPPNQPDRSSDRIDAIDLLRGFAALAVVLFHFTTRYRQLHGGGESLAIEVPYGHYGVDLFFIISGFVITMTIARCRSVQDFLISRVSRLYPVFWVSALLTYVVGKLLPLPGVEHSVTQLLANLTMFNEFIHIRPLDSAYWSLTYELGFYLAIVALFATGAITRIEVFCWIWMAGALTFHLWSRWLPHPLHYMTVLHTYGHLFAVGIALYRMRSQGVTPSRWLLLPAAVLVQFAIGTLVDTLAIVICLALMGMALAGWLRPLCTPVLLWLGAISYPLYLTHELIGWTLLYRLYQTEIAPALAIGLVLTGMLALASLLHVTVEVPAMRWVRQRYKRKTATAHT